MPYAAAVSTHPVTAVAAGEVTGQVLETLGAHLDLVCCFVTAGHAGALDDVAATVDSVLSPTLLIGCATGAVLANSTEVEAGPGIALWAAMTGPVAPLRVGGGRAEPLAGADRAFRPAGAVVIGDARSFDAAGWLDTMADTHPGTPVAGGLCTGPMLLGGRVVTGGAVGAVIGQGVEFDAVVSQGCRTIGRPMTVTRSEGNIVYQVAGRSPLSALVDVVEDQVAASEIRLINEGLHLAMAVDEAGDDANLLMRPVLGADRASGALAVGAEVPVGTTVWFGVRDPEAADADLHTTLASRQADGALLFSCNGRGTAMFAEPNHDVEAVGAELGYPPVGGFFAAGEMGPVGGVPVLRPGGGHPGGRRSWLHGQSAALALFRDR